MNFPSWLYSSILLVCVSSVLFFHLCVPPLCHPTEPVDPLDAFAAVGKVSPALAGRIKVHGEVEAMVIFNVDDIREHAGHQRKAFGLQANNITILAEKRRLYELRKNAVLSRLGMGDYTVEADYENLPVVHLKINAKALDRLLRMGEVASVQENKVVYMSLNQSLPLINALDTHGSGYTGSGTAVAVLDTGLNYTHVDFGSCTSPGVPSSCKVAYVQDFAPNDYALDDNGHGTNVSGVVVGVAPDTELIGLDVFDGDLAYYSHITAAINWVISNKATYNIVAINLSLGGASKYTSECPTDTLAVGIADLKTAGITTAVASGNESFLDGLSSPACAPDGISVGAVYDANVGGISYTDCSDSTSSSDKVTCFSNSAVYLKMLAPGSLTTAAGITMAGTSQAAPHVAGAVAVLKESEPGLTVDAITTRLTGTGVSVTDHRNSLVKPRLNLYDAVFSNALIGFAPASLSFNAIRNGTLAPSQTLTIRNDGVGAMNWTVADAQSWLDLSPISGIGDGSVLASINTSSLAVGEYSAAITITSPAADNSPQNVPVYLTIFDPAYSEDFESGDLIHLPWETSGDRPWDVQGTAVYGGSFSAESGAIGDGQTSRLQITLNVTESGYVYFRLKTSTEAELDKLVFRVDNNDSYGKWDGWHGENDWIQAVSSIAIDPGVHVFTWDYVKDAGGSAGSDRVWLDDIVFPAFNFEIQNIALSPTGYDFGNQVVGSSSAAQTFNISNTGTNNLDIGAVTLAGADPAHFGIQNDTCSGQILVPGAGCVLEVFFSPTASGSMNAVLSLSSNDPDTPILTADLSGTGLDFFAFTVSKNGSGAGTVTSSPVGIECGVDCSNTYPVGQLVTLNAVADGESSFDGWAGGGCSGTGTCAVTLTEFTEVTATFSKYPPVADFSGSSVSGNVPLIINFVDSSTNTPTSWLWDFGDSQTAAVQNPTHVYTSTGVYTVNLTAVNAGGSDGESKIDYINAGSCPNQPVRVGSNYYLTLQDGYDAALEGETIEMHISNFPENLVLNKDITITLSQGYNCEYNAQASGTTLAGSLTISAGTLVVADLVIE